MSDASDKKMSAHILARNGRPLRLRRKRAIVTAHWVSTGGDKHYGDYVPGHWLVVFEDGKQERMSADRLYDEFEPAGPPPSKEGR